jgi:hypothetical protein
LAAKAATVHANSTIKASIRFMVRFFLGESERRSVRALIRNSPAFVLVDPVLSLAHPFREAVAEIVVSEIDYEVFTGVRRHARVFLHKS